MMFLKINDGSTLKICIKYNHICTFLLFWLHAAGFCEAVVFAVLVLQYGGFFVFSRLHQIGSGAMID